MCTGFIMYMETVKIYGYLLSKKTQKREREREERGRDAQTTHSVFHLALKVRRILTKTY